MILKPWSSANLETIYKIKKRQLLKKPFGKSYSPAFVPKNPLNARKTSNLGGIFYYEYLSEKFSRNALIAD